jgi:hypothetical protein
MPSITAFTHNDALQLCLLDHLETILERLLREMEPHYRGYLQVFLLDTYPVKFKLSFQADPKPILEICRQFGLIEYPTSRGGIGIKAQAILTTIHSNIDNSTSVPVIIELVVPELELSLNVFTTPAPDYVEVCEERVRPVVRWLDVIKNEIARLQNRETAQSIGEPKSPYRRY